jgi:protein-S-isoprenylcysteine O-methyltransferase Ste14
MLSALLILTALAGFSLLHTALASYRFKASASQLLGESTATAIYRLAFNVIAALSIAPALYLSLTLPDRELYQIPEPWNYLALLVQVLAGLGIVYSLYQLDLPFFVGLRQLFGLTGSAAAAALNSTSTARLVTAGLHRYVRHPLYTTSLIVLYLVSPMTVNRLAFVIGVHLYFFVGSIFEERKLVCEFGEAYRQYQRKVPRLLPRPWLLRHQAAD